MRLLLAALSAASAARTVFQNREKYAAFDTERAVASTGGATLRVGAPRHARVVLGETEPWEASIGQGAPALLHDRKRRKWRLWYEGCAKTAADALSDCAKRYLLHAESDDGVAWTKRALFLNAWPAGSRDRANNVVLAAEGLRVFEDHSRQEPRLRRFKAFGSSALDAGDAKPVAGGALSSADGLRFARAAGGRVPAYARSAFWDVAKRSYVAYAEQHVSGNATVVRHEANVWSGPYTSKPLSDAPAVVVPYYSAYVGIIRNEQTCSFAWSSDGVRWSPLEDKAKTIPIETNCATPLDPVQDPRSGELRLYAFDGAKNASLTLYRFHADGFAGLRSSTQALITSRVLPCKGRLPVVTASITGSLRVAVYDEDGNAIRGRSLEESLPMLLDAVDEEVVWRSAHFAKIPDRCVLKFEVKDATLFSFGWTRGPRDRPLKRVYRERRHVAKAEGRGLLRLFASLALTTAACVAARVLALRLCACLRRNEVKRGESV